MEAGRGGRMGGSCPARREVGQAVGWQGRVSRRAQVDASAHELPIGLVGEAKASPWFRLSPHPNPFPQAGRGGFLRAPNGFFLVPSPRPSPQAGEGIMGHPLACDALACTCRGYVGSSNGQPICPLAPFAGNRGEAEIPEGSSCQRERTARWRMKMTAADQAPKARKAGKEPWASQESPAVAASLAMTSGSAAVAIAEQTARQKPAMMVVFGMRRTGELSGEAT